MFYAPGKGGSPSAPRPARTETQPGFAPHPPAEKAAYKAARGGAGYRGYGGFVQTGFAPHFTGVCPALCARGGVYTVASAKFERGVALIGHLDDLYARLREDARRRGSGVFCRVFIVRRGERVDYVLVGGQPSVALGDGGARSPQLVAQLLRKLFELVSFFTSSSASSAPSQASPQSPSSSMALL